jgi:hypothetical protein
MAFELKIEPEVFLDIQEGIDWYNNQQRGLGHDFYSEVIACFKKLQQHPFFQIRYDNVRCLPMEKYPYMIHFTVDEKDKRVIVRAVLNTSRDPDHWKN